VSAAEPAPQRKLILTGTLVSIGGQGVSQGLRFASNVILTRLLFPEAFALMAVLSTIVMGLEMFLDTGVRLSVIQHPRGEDPDFYNTAWTAQVARGIAITVVGSCLAWPLSLFFEDPRLTTFVPIMVLTSTLSGFQSTRMAILQRRMQITRVVAFNVASQLISSAVMIAHAYYYRSEWSLVTGTLVGAGVMTLMSHTLIPGPRTRLRWDPAAARDMTKFGRWILLSTMITFLAVRLDIILLKLLISERELGVYQTGLTLANVPMTLGGQVIGSILLPALARAHRGAPGELAVAYHRARSVMLPVSGLAVLGVVMFSAPLFGFLYDDRYRDAMWIAPLVSMTVWFTMLQEASGRALQAVGNARALSAANLVKLVTTGLGCYAGFHLGGFVGFIVGSAVGAAAGHSTLVVSLNRLGLESGLTDLKFTIAVFAMGGLGVVGPTLLAPLVGMRPQGLALILNVPVLGAITLVVGRRVLGAYRASRPKELPTTDLPPPPTPAPDAG
jgi:O-antigen/teichoic acid export membrane protein